MSSELESLKQRITELGAKNAKLEAENKELRKENTEISYLRNKLSVSDAEIAELKRSNIEFLRANKEHNERRDAENAKLRAENVEFRDRLTKVEQNQSLIDNSSNDITPNNNSSNFALAPSANSGVVHHEKPLEEKKMDSSLLEAHKKIVSSEIKQHNKECQADRKKLHTESMASSGQEVAKQSGQNSHKKKDTENIVQAIIGGIQDDIKRQEPTSSGSSLEVLQVTEISATGRRPKCSSSLLDLAHLFDKASDAEYRTKKANEEEILCWINFGKEFIYQYNNIVENSNGKIGEKKAKGIIYDEMLEYLATIREKRSKEMGIQLPKISRSSLTRRTQRSMKLVRIFEKIGTDKIMYLSEYSANSVSELANDQIQEIIDYGISLEKLSQRKREAGHVSENSAEVSIPTPPIPLVHVSNSSSDSSKIGPVDSPKSQVSVPSTSSSDQISKSNRSGLPVSILPEDPEEKRKYIIGLVLERFPSLSLSDSSERGERFDLNSSTLCPLCNGDQNLWNNIRGEWGDGEYCGEETYRIKCRHPRNRGTPIVSVKA
jgi:hypothetical protein